MSESNLYNGRGTVSNSAINKRTTEKADMYDDLKNREAFNSAVRANLDRAVKEGYSRGANDVYRAVASPITEGSPMDMQMQRNVDKGLSYEEPQEPGLLDAISRLLSSNKPSVNPYQEQAEMSADDMREDAYTSAFATAESMGGTSEENMNNLITQELIKRGL